MVLGGVLTLAAIYDAREERIPNKLILAGLLTGLGFCLQEAGVGGIIHFVWKALWPVSVLFVLFLIRAIGAGDIKLFSVISVFLSTEDTAYIIVASFLIGAFVSLLRILCRRQTYYRMGSLMAYARSCVAARKLLSYQPPELPGSYLHFAVCILSGYLVVTGYRVWLG